MKEKTKVLVVDDEAVVGRSFDRVLSPKGYDVDMAFNGPEALNKVGTDGYDVVFADIKMPGMDGLEVATRIKEMNPWLPVVIVTGYGTTENETRAQEIGVSGFVHKPLSPEVIERITESALQETPSPAAAVEERTEPAVSARSDAEPAKKENVARNVALFFAAPFIGLAYIIAFPFIGFYMMGKYAFKALLHKEG